MTLTELKPVVVVAAVLPRSFRGLLFLERSSNT